MTWGTCQLYPLEPSISLFRLYSEYDLLKSILLLSPDILKFASFILVNMHIIVQHF